MTAAILALVLLVLGLIWRQRGRGNLHRLTAPKVIESAPPVRPGGLDVVTLSRLSTVDSAVPEFLSAQLLPGLGMRVLQLTASLPEKGNVPLFPSPAPEQMRNTESEGAAFVVMTDYGQKRGATLGSLGLASRAADQVENNTMPDGGTAVARFYPAVNSAAAGAPASETPRENGIETSVSALLSGHALDLTVTARNVTEQPHTVILSWTPRFLAPSGNLRDYRLVVPSSDRIAGNGAKSVHGSSEDFSGSEGAQLGDAPIDATFVNLKHSFLGNGPVAELRDMRNNVSLRLTALSPSIRSLHVATSPDGKSIELAYSTAEGGLHSASANDSLLRPGQQMQWKVRVEIAASMHDRSIPQIPGFSVGNE